MEQCQGMFAIKLHDMDLEYSKMRSRMQICQNKEHGKISSEIEKMKEETYEAEMALQRMIDNGRSRFAVTFAKAQKDYQNKVENCLSKLKVERMSAAERADAMALYAEYAIDFAVMSMRHALLASLTAIDLQMDADKAADRK